MATQLSSSSETAINGYLTSLYSGSTTAAAMFDAWHSTGALTRIGGDTSGDPGHAYNSNLTGPFVVYDLTAISNLYYFNDQGELVHEKPELSIVHELAHMMVGVGDVTGVTDTDMRCGDTIPIPSLRLSGRDGEMWGHDTYPQPSFIRSRS